MKPTTMRLIGIALLIVAFVIAIMNLKRVANLGLGSTVGVLVILGIVLVARAKRPR
jgi:hypothetical protein